MLADSLWGRAWRATLRQTQETYVRPQFHFLKNEINSSYILLSMISSSEYSAVLAEIASNWRLSALVVVLVGLDARGVSGP